MILLDGQLSLRIPTPPDIMLKYINDLIIQEDLKESEKQAKALQAQQAGSIEEEDESVEDANDLSEILLTKNSKEQI
jgi:hypothetical protein